MESMNVSMHQAKAEFLVMYYIENKTYPEIFFPSLLCAASEHPMWPFKLIGLLVKYSVKLGLSLHRCQWVASFWSGFDLAYSVLSNLHSSHTSCSFSGCAAL